MEFLLSPHVQGCFGENNATEVDTLNSVFHTLNAHLLSALKLMELFWS